MRKTVTYKNIIGTYDILTGTAEGSLDKAGTFENNGSTDVHWDGQTSVELDGQPVLIGDDYHLYIREPDGTFTPVEVTITTTVRRISKLEAPDV